MNDKVPLSRAERRRAAKLAGKAAAKQTVSPDSLKTAIHSSYQAGDLHNARRLMGRLLKLTPDDLATLSFAGMLAQRDQDLDAAIGFFAKVHNAQPGDTSARALINALHSALHDNLQQKKSNKVIELAEQLLVLQPQSLESVALMAMAQLHNKDRQAAEQTLGLNQLVEVCDLSAPVGWADMAAFNAALAQEIAGDPSMAVPAENHPTYHNRHLKITAPLNTNQSAVVTALTRLIEESVALYKDQRADLNHKFLTRWPENSRLEAWGTLLEGEGTVDAHIHLEGYLGMVYYPELPPEVVDGQGWLELGHPPEDFPLTLEPITQLIEPKPGRLVIFPGYLFHRTTPFNSKHRRISIAYDVVAV